MSLVPEFAEVAPEIRRQISCDALYRQFAERQDRDARALERDDAVTIPGDFVYLGLPGLSKELQLKLDRLRPASLSDAARIEGMTPAALALLLARIRRASAVAQ